ncbi:hypothetical protein PSTG_13005 [Puccinia striiformis f. sp. tritici PST-78]|uniref:Uncharacterized protein n=1 Tax=Puccinia striiformis f. sp. tritici PST-78 TaxID=1165861 RepID=A0A0L0V3T1_9BASI|nr:hypothetical protein PSTG_13005 [Puccinia striiformis f. sp. tritici PST-78]
MSLRLIFILSILSSSLGIITDAGLSSYGIQEEGGKDANLDSGRGTSCVCCSNLAPIPVLNTQVLRRLGASPACQEAIPTAWSFSSLLRGYPNGLELIQLFGNLSQWLGEAPSCWEAIPTAWGSSILLGGYPNGLEKLQLLRKLSQRLEASTGHQELKGYWLAVPGYPHKKMKKNPTPVPVHDTRTAGTPLPGE